MNERENPSRFATTEQEEQEWEGGIFDSFLSFVSGAKGKTPQPTSIDHSSERFSPSSPHAPFRACCALGRVYRGLGLELGQEEGEGRSKGEFDIGTKGRSYTVVATAARTE